MISPGVGHVFYPVLLKPDVRKELGLNDEQLTKLLAAIDSQPSRELYKVQEQKRGGRENPKADRPELQQKSQELETQLREQIKGVFTPQQWTTLKTILRQKAMVRSLENPRILEGLSFTEQQKKQLRQLREDRANILPEVGRKVGEPLLNTLTPQQRQKLSEELDRQEWLNL